MYRAALYLRLSKEDLVKEDESSSITNQRLLLTDYALEKGFAIADTYSDDDFSGLYEERPEFERLIKDAKLGKFDIVIAKSQSRFTRNMEHMEKYLHHMFPLLGIRFIGVVDGVDTNAQSNKKARQIAGLTNEWYCEDLSASIKAVFKQKMKAGQFLGSFAPYGYLKDPKDKYQFIIDEYAANVIRRIYSLYLQGFSNIAICRMLEDDNIPNPTVYKKEQGLSYANVKANEFSTKYHFWSETTVKRILTNRTYIGFLEQGKWEKISYKDRKVIEKPKNDWIVVENHHEPIIEKELFFQVQELRKSRRVAIDCDRKKVHLFAGKLKCADCNSTMIKSSYVRGTTQDWYFRCQLSNKSRKILCSSHSIRYSKIEAAVLHGIREFADYILNDKDVKDSIGSLLESLEDDEKLRKGKIAKMNEYANKVDEATKSIQFMYADRANGIIGEAMFAELIQNTERELQVHREKMQQMEKELAEMNEQKKNKPSLENLISKYCDYSVLTHEMVADFVDYILIGRNDTDTENEQELSIYWNF